MNDFNIDDDYKGDIFKLPCEQRAIAKYFLLGRQVIIRNDRIIGVIDMGNFTLNGFEYDYIKPTPEYELYKHNNYEKDFYFMIKQRIGELGIDA